MPADLLTVPPSSSLWLNELRFGSFPGLVALLDDPTALACRVAAAYGGSAPTRVLNEVLEAAGDTPEVRLHLLLVAAFLEKKKSAAVKDVALARLAPEEVTRLGGATDSMSRLPLAVHLYLDDPANLLALEVCHRWHSARRCALELVGPRRAPIVPFGGLDWQAIGAASVTALPASLRSRYQPSWRLHLPRRGGVEALVAFRERAEPDTVRDARGEVLAGHRDGWTVLRFHQDGLRVDVTGRSLALGQALANAAGSRLFGAVVEYRPARGRLTREAMQEFLVRLRDPEDDVFRLLEIVGEVQAVEDRPLLRVGNAGQARAEVALGVIRQSISFAERWEGVHQVKVGFGRHHRIVVHFPLPDGPLVLTYSDNERDKDTSAAFEALFRSELGIEINPKTARSPDRTRHHPPEPRRLGAAAWRRVLGPVLDEPAPWEAKAVADLAAMDLVDFTESAVLRCGDPGIDPEAVGADSLDCPGEVEMPYGEADPNDRFRQEDDAEYVCGTCGRVWHPGRHRLPLFKRLRVRVDPGEAWARLLEAAGARGRFEEEAPGVASGIVGGVRVYLVWLPTAPEAFRRADMAAVRATCVASRPRDPNLAAFGEAAFDLADFLYDERVLDRAMEAARNRVPAGYPLLPVPVPAFAADLVPYRSAPPAAVPGRVLPERAVITRDAQGLWLGRQKIASARSTGVLHLLALLDTAVRKDEKEGTERRFRTAEQLVKLGKGLTATNVQTWVGRGRQAIAETTRDEALAGAIIEGERGKGYRLGAGFECWGVEG